MSTQRAQRRASGKESDLRAHGVLTRTFLKRRLFFDAGEPAVIREKRGAPKARLVCGWWWFGELRWKLRPRCNINLQSNERGHRELIDATNEIYAQRGHRLLFGF